MRKITIRSMSYDEFDAYQDFIDELKDQGVKEDKIGRKAARWVMENVYKVDLSRNDCTPGQIMQIVADTTEATLKTEDKDEKNQQSGGGGTRMSILSFVNNAENGTNK